MSKRSLTIEFTDPDWAYLTSQAAYQNITAAEFVQRIVSRSRVGKSKKSDIQEIPSMAFADFEIIVGVVAKAEHVEPNDLLADDRGQAKVANARHLAMWLLHSTSPLSYPEIGRLFGRHHTAIMNGVQNVERRRADDAAFRVKSDALKQVVRPDQPAEPFTPRQQDELRRRGLHHKAGGR